jgi:chromosome segregation ATPase
MLSRNAAQDKTSEMERIEREIAREKRNLQDYEKRFNFQKGEYESRLAKLEIRHKTQLQDYESLQQRQAGSLQDKDNTRLERLKRAHADIQRDLDSQITRLEQTKQETERRLKKEQDKEEKKRITPLEVERDPQVMRANDQVERLRRQLQEIERTEKKLEQELKSKEMRFSKRLELEEDKLRRTLKKERDTLNDEWLRTEKYFQSHMQVSKSILDRLKSEYESRKRTYLIDKKRKEQMDSRQRAQHGDDQGKRNFALENPIMGTKTGEDEEGEDAHRFNERNVQRRHLR